MSASFAAAAARLSGLAARALGWTPATFWNATPSELALCLHGDEPAALAPPSREEIAAMIEKDRR